MTLSRIPAAFEVSGTTIEERLSKAQKTLAARLPPKEVKAVKAAADAAGQTCSEWMREAVLLHLKRPSRKKKPTPDPVLLAELMALRSMLQNLMAAASEIPEATIQQIVRHADSIKEGKAEEILKRLELAHAGDTEA